MAKITDKLKEIYDKKYKTLLLIPIILVLLSIGIIANHYITTGEFIKKDITLQGGVSITASTTKVIDEAALKNNLQAKFPQSDINIRELTENGKITGLEISATDVTPDEFSEVIKTELSLTKDDLAVESTGASLGSSFFRETIKAIIVAFIFMAIVVFLCFRVPVPAFAVVLAAFCDMLCTWAVLLVFDVRLSTAGVAALIMLIGYSVDTDILLTTRVLRRKEGSVFDSVFGAFKTGMVMSLTAIFVVSISFFLTSSLVLKQIMLILMIGLIFDIINTFLQNAGILRWYLEKKGDKIKRLDTD